MPKWNWMCANLTKFGENQSITVRDVLQIVVICPISPRWRTWKSDPGSASWIGSTPNFNQFYRVAPCPCLPGLVDCRRMSSTRSWVIWWTSHTQRHTHRRLHIQRHTQTRYRKCHMLCSRRKVVFLQGGQQCWALWAFLAACPCTLFIDVISLFVDWANKDACLS